jgi:site-specific DNA recombinase
MKTAAIYTRFSSDKQREASTEDQARNCRQRILAEGWELVEHFRDEAISGSVADRPGYQRMLKAAKAGAFSTLIVDDLSRLGRDQVECERTGRRLEFGGTCVIGISDGYDSASKSRKVQRGMRFLMNEVFLDDLRDKTHRGLTGQAMKKFWAGGKPYGYRLVQLKDEKRLDVHGSAAIIGTMLEIDAEQAVIVREIFQNFANDWSPRKIADALNQRAVPSPGSHWRNRTVRRASGWMGSGVRALLRNPLYAGKLVWNRTAWVKDPDSGRRITKARPASEHVSHDMPELRIIDVALWDRVQARWQRSAVRGASVREALSRTPHSGRSAKFSFSGLLKCGLCGSNLVITGGQGKFKSYCCSSYKDGGKAACSNSIAVRLSVVQTRLLASIKDGLLTDDVVAKVVRRAAQELAKPVKPASNANRIAELHTEVGNLTGAIASGLLRASPALAQRLASAEAELARLASAAARPAANLVNLPTRLKARYRQLAGELETFMERDPHRARAALREITGEIPVVPDEAGKCLVAQIGLNEKALLRATGSSQNFVVAGACYTMFRSP